MTVNDLYRLIYGPQSGPVALGLIVLLGLVFTWVDHNKRNARRGGAVTNKIQRHLKDPFFLGMLIAAGLATWLLWPIAPEFIWLFWIIPALLPIMAVGAKEQVVCRLCGYTWSINDFCRGWLITGDTGSGKTFALRRLMHEVFKNTKKRPWGGLVIDEKGDEVRALVEIAQHYGRAGDLRILETRPDDAPASWTPKEKFNLLYDFRIPASTYAKAMVDTACMIGGKENDQAFFRNQAQINLGEGIELLRVMDRIPTISDLLEVLRYKDILAGCVLEIEPKANQGDPLASRLVNHFRNSYLKQPEEQLGGVISTIETFLLYFTQPDVAEIFSTDENTFDFDIMEEGGIIGVSMPQKLAIERRYINCLLKLLFYQHVRQRFRVKDKTDLNLLVLWQDEVQRFVSEADGDVDIMRSARGTSVMATQSKISLFPPLGGKDKANVTILNLRNRIIFTAADKDCAELSAEMIGKRKEWKRSISSGRGGRSTTRSEEENFWVKASDFMTLPKFQAVLRHASGRWKRCTVPPLNNQGLVPPWFQMGQY
ncbi:MAG TPA: type IV secretion system DNA-binding domain-containing protein [Chthoniobacterales bacterium]